MLHSVIKVVLITNLCFLQHWNYILVCRSMWCATQAAIRKSSFK